ncbi:related to excitatory amino acid transporter [Ramularia collo-cygni]|uniref:Amino acid transporter n=1 Tax=Ramularia collo-cygni TaxID=112498 RepID=A0A2D3V757_9PEZI|nr:related to excitatory amino acid transporter [Ramularia collo-cygni]CZT19396.1 related to excitatory amino acid transporter [Ramularia collo-cygni]
MFLGDHSEERPTRLTPRQIEGPTTRDPVHFQQLLTKAASRIGKNPSQLANPFMWCEAWNGLRLPGHGMAVYAQCHALATPFNVAFLSKLVAGPRSRPCLLTILLDTMATEGNHYEKGVAAEEGLTPPPQDRGHSIDGQPEKLSVKQRFVRALVTPGSAIQIVIAAVLGLGIGLAVSSTTEDIPEAAPVLLQIPGQLWLRALRATVLPLIVTAMILAVQNLKDMSQGGSKLVRWSIGYYVLTTIFAVVHSMIMVDLVWTTLMVQADEATLGDISEADQETIDERSSNAPHDIIVSVFTSFVPQNVVQALAEDQLLGVLVTAIVVGCLLKRDSALLRAVKEIDKIVFIVINFLIKLAPIGVFFLILSNLLRLNIADVGQNLGVLIGASVAGMFIHLFIMLPIIFFAFTRRNPYTWWMKHSPAWITAWGSASSAATLPVTMRCLRKNGVAEPIVLFTAPLGALVNMDGTAIYFPVVVVFLAVTQGQTLNAGDYALIVILSVLSSIATTPIPSSSLVLTVVIANSVGIPVTGMYGVVVAIDWFIDRFRTALNVSGDVFAASVLEKMSGITNETGQLPEQAVFDRQVAGEEATPTVSENSATSVDVIQPTKV